MTNIELQNLLRLLPDEAEVSVEARTNVPEDSEDLEDLSEADQMIEDGELLRLTDSRSVLYNGGVSIRLIGDKVWD